MTVALSDDARRLLDGANFGHLSTLMPDGAPKVEPVWVAREGDRVLAGQGQCLVHAVGVERLAAAQDRGQGLIGHADQVHLRLPVLE